MRAAYVIFIFLLCIACSTPQICHAGGDGKLLKIVALSRHGVRAPTQSATTLELWSQKVWPSWPVAKGELTPRGGQLITAMWRNMRQNFIDAGLLPESACPSANALYVRADVDERTKATARALLNGLVPGCRTGFAVENGSVDPLFHPVKAGLYHFDPFPAATNVMGMMDGGLEALQDDLAPILATLGKINGPLAPNLCSRFSLMPNCQIWDLPNAISIAHDSANVRLVGSLGIASSLAEIFLLEYGEWPDVAAAWGQVNASTLAQILPVHSEVFDVINRAPLIAWAKGSSLLVEMADALNGTHYDPRCNEANIVVFVGHDTNIANVGALLGAGWQAKSYPKNGIPPGGVLFLELWDNQGRKEVRLRFYAQTMESLHTAFEKEKDEVPANLKKFAPVGVPAVLPPVVGEARLTLDNFMRLVQRVTEGAPIAPEQKPGMDFSAVISPKYH